MELLGHMVVLFLAFWGTFKLLPMVLLPSIWRELTSIFLKLFPKKIAEGRTLPRSFYEATITLTPKQDKDITQKKNRLISLMNIDTKLFSKIQQMKSNNKWNPNERIIHPDQVSFISKMQGYFNICKLDNVIHHINKLKHKKKKNTW